LSRSIENPAARPVSILCTYAWWPVSKTILVVRRPEHPVDRHRELDDAEVGTQVPAVERHRLDDPLSDLLGKLVELLVTQAAQVVGSADPSSRVMPALPSSSGPPS
jgi:hypothetical protein